MPAGRSDNGLNGVAAIHLGWQGRFWAIWTHVVIEGAPGYVREECGCFSRMNQTTVSSPSSWPASFTTCAFSEIGVDSVWRGGGAEDKGLRASDSRVLVEIDPRYLLAGHPAKAKLDWSHQTHWRDLRAEDLATLAKERRQYAR